MGKKVLIWDKRIPLKNTGGPSGYLFNIYTFIKATNKYECIDFYSQKAKIDSLEYNFQSSNNIIFQIIGVIKLCYFIYFKSTKLSKEDLELIDKYDYIHLHYIGDYFRYFKKQSGIKSKIILTTHSPEPLFDELFYHKKGLKELLKKNKFIRNYFLKKEANVYNLTDYIMFPVKDAKEVYINSSKVFDEVFNANEFKTFYVPTALNSTIKIKTINNYLKDKQIPNNALTVCYIGRHNEIKGYYQLQKIAQYIWDINPNIYFIIGGKYNPKDIVNDKRWIELGWIDTPALLNEIDIFILPNKETYFDLILLEVLRQQKPIILSRTGGNKWFENKCKAINIYDYSDVNSCCKFIQHYYKEKEDNNLLIYESYIKRFYVNNLSMDIYLNNYITTINNLK